MKNILFISFLIYTIYSSAQTVNGNGVAVKQTMNVLVEDKSVEAVNAYWSQKNYSDAMNRINEARYERISNWVDKPFSFSSDISSYKYIVLLPPKKHHKDIKRNLKKRMKGIPITYVNVQKPYETHSKLPEQIKANPNSTLWLTVDLRAPYLVETYMQIYNSNGELIYSMGKEALSAASAFKNFRNDLDFALSF